MLPLRDLVISARLQPDPDPTNPSFNVFTVGYDEPVSDNYALYNTILYNI